MKKVFITKNYFGQNTAESKAKIDCEEILLRMGYKNLGLPRTLYQNRKVSSVFTLLSSLLGRLRMPKDGIAVFQYPKSTIKQELRRAKQRGCRTIVIVHDLETLRGYGETIDETMSWTENADVIIVHTDRMAEYMRAKFPEKKIIALGIFDYLCKIEDNPVPTGKKYAVAFAGNLTKSAFLTEIEPREYTLNLFGKKRENQKFHENVRYLGMFPPEELASHLNSNFGLVWDGDLEGTGNMGEYLKFISPHKLSMYISAGLPVIIRKGTAMAPFVEKHGIGITVERLSDLDDVLSQMSRTEYEKMRSNTAGIRQMLCNGEFFSKAVKKGE